MRKLTAALTGITTLSAFALTGGCSLVGIRTTEEPPYALIEEEGAFEVRRYEDVLIAETVVEVTDYDESGSVGFGRLGGFIFGDNVAPDSEESRKVSMTAPVIQERSDDRWVMRFVRPEEHSEETLPRPTDPAVTIRRQPGRVIATVRYTGLVSEETIREKSDELLRWLGKKGWESASSPRSARYDPPWTIPFLRRNEIMIDVRKAVESAPPEPVSSRD